MASARSNYVQQPTTPRAPIQQEDHAAPLLRKKKQQRWTGWLIAIVILGAVVVAVQYFSVTEVRLVQPRTVKTTETLALAGVSEGRIETPVSADAAGTVTELLVRENASVKKGQLLANVQNRIPLAQVTQAEAALETALAQQRLLQAGTQNTQLQAAQAQIAQADAGIGQAQAVVAKARAGVAQANAAMQERRATLSQANSAVSQASSQLDLARKTMDRARILGEEGVIPRAQLDQAESAFTVAESNLDAAKQSVKVANAGILAAQAADAAAVQDVSAALQSLNYAHSVRKQAVAAAATLRQQPRPEALAVAKAQVSQARATLEQAHQGLKVTEVRAPFDGTVTEIIAEAGSAVTPAGILTMVQSSKMQVRLDVDESNIVDLRTGQKAIITNPSLPNQPMQGVVTRIADRVDPARGTVEVVVTPVKPESWIRSGQTVDVNVILREGVQRLTVPSSALTKHGDQTLVFLAKDGKAVGRSVTPGLTANGWTTILSGLDPNELTIENPAGLADGSKVRSKG
jgi:RND family efflux transporter MFP subunit